MIEEGVAGATLSIDAGTSLVKAVVFDERGSPLGIATTPTTVLTPSPGHSEQDMDAVWEAVVAACREAVSSAGAHIARVAVTAQGDGAWIIDGCRRPTGTAILWNDVRARAVVDRWTVDGTAALSASINRSMTNAGLPNAVMRHMLEHDDHRLAGAAAVLTCGSWLFLQLTGTVGLHESEASVPWLDVCSRQYDDELIDRYGLTALRGLLPPVLSSDDAIATITDDTAAAIGLDRGTPIVLAPYDLLTAAAGCGAVGVGDAVCILGTTLCVAEVIDDVTGGDPATGLTLADREGRYLRAIPTLAGTGVLDWLAALVGVADVGALIRLAADVPAGADGLTVLPYLSPAGERAPFLDPDVRGCVTGLTFLHGAGHLAKAALEGLAHVVRDCVDALPHRPLTLSLAGGGARSQTWSEVIADVTGIALVQPGDDQPGAKGAMIHALVVTGVVDDLATAARDLTSRGRVVEPRQATATLHDQRHRVFLRTRAAIAADRATSKRAAPDAGGDG